MKRFLSITTLMLATLLSFGQMLSTSNFTVESKATKKVSTMPNIKSATPFWTENFSNGIPATWTNSTAPWVYRGSTTTPNQNTGSQGAYSGNGDPISSATPNNGFIIFDSDYYDNNGTQGNFGNGPYPTPHNGDLKTDMIDLSAYTDVMVKMNSYFRTFQGQAFINFYVNGTYDSQVEVHSDLSVNESTLTDAVALVRLPISVSGNANVQMEFQFEGTTQSNVNGSGYYFWMIDDIELMETPAHLMDVTDVVHGGWNSTPFSQGFGMDYTFKPLLQSNANPYTFEMIMANIGANDLTGAQMNIEVYDDINTQVFSSNSTPTTLVQLDTVVFVANQTYAPTNIGMYNMRFWGSSDSITYTDTTYMQAIITDTIYGRDYGNPSGSWRVGRQCGGLQVGNIFDIYAADELTSVSAHVADYSIAGAKMFGVLYEVDTTTSPMGFIMIDLTDDYTIQQADTNNWVTIPFNSAILIDPQFGQQYMIAIGGYAHPLDTFGINVSGDAEVTMSRIQDNGCNLGSQGFGYWYWVSETPMVRMNFGNAINNPCAGFFVNTTSTDGICGQNNGSISAITSGGTPPFTYSWNTTPPQTTINATALGVGLYQITVTDANNCTAVSQGSVGQSSGITATTSTTQTTACTSSDGTATVTSSGGTPPYSYFWSNGDVTQTADSLAVGQWSVIITDANGCNENAIALVSSVASPVAVIDSNGVTHVSCFGLSDGSATVQVTGGTSPYTYSWSNGASTQNLSNVTSGTYIVIVTDAANCDVYASVTIIQPDDIVGSTSMTAETLSGAMDGTATVSIISGGTPPFTYSWSPGGQTTSTATGLAGNTTYTVIVTDANGCSKTLSVFVVGVGVGVNDQSYSNKIRVYPNPSEGRFYVELNNMSKDYYRFTITNVIGQEVYSNTREVHGLAREVIDISAFEKGLYFLNIKGSSYRTTERIIVE